MTGVVVELFRMSDDNNPNVLTLCPVRCDGVLGSHKQKLCKRMLGYVTCYESKSVM